MGISIKTLSVELLMIYSYCMIICFLQVSTQKPERSMAIIK